MYKLKKIPLLLSVLLLSLQGCSGSKVTASDMQGEKFFIRFQMLLILQVNILWMNLQNVEKTLYLLIICRNLMRN